eukprot:6725723-Ditylum_brightwellii.AAC.1
MEMEIIFQVPNLQGMSVVDCPSNFNLIDLKDIYKSFTIIPYNYLPATKADAAIQATVYKYVNKNFIEPLQKIHFLGCFKTF